ncbi:MAG TPA: DinB family protein [Pyrinomonadaceae bacterium]|nr:DinB family protein [Pyrinomonadaceae bacterium]
MRTSRTSAPRISTDGQALIDAWHTNHRITVYLIKNLPPRLWSMNVPGSPRRTVRAIAAHIHNARCMWIKMIGARHGVAVPKTVDGRTVRPAELVRALERSSRGMIDLIELGTARGGTIPPATWQNFPTDLVHFLTYFVAHEAHHRGQLVMLARQLGHRLPVEVTGGLWQWKKRSQE